MTKAVMAL